ncbi:type II secretion system protein [Candidatus Saccharibacteria bacterium]|nr:type II secretion system protein [Candidatus Saccharibacteria bacterium]
MKQKANGFTMIEVVLVLAISGAIFAAIFIALNGVWADERDNERRADVMTFIRELKNFQTNNSRGALPGSTGGDKQLFDDKKMVTIVYNDDGRVNTAATNSDRNSNISWYGFYNDYFDINFTDPDGPRYNLSAVKCISTGPDQRCTNPGLDEISNGTFSNNAFSYTLFVVTEAVCDGEDAKKSLNPRNVAVLYRMEAGGVYCENT